LHENESDCHAEHRSAKHGETRFGFKQQQVNAVLESHFMLKRSEEQNALFKNRKAVDPDVINPEETSEAKIGLHNWPISLE
jgi:hypothetical protein